jgi:phosphoglycerate dehydrogenase-like enzyme
MTGAPVRILLSRPAAQRLETQIREALQGREVVLLHPDTAEAATADIAFVSRDVTGLSTKHRILPDTQRFYDALLAARGLRWVHVHSAGADRAVYLELRARGVELTTSAGANAPVVAQTALLGVLALARHWPRLVAAQREHRWAPLIESGLPRDLGGQTAVVVGWGSVGREIGRLLQAVGLEVVAVRRDAGASDDKRVVGSARLHAVLPQADWLVLACALTPQTRGLIGERELELLPRHAHVVNVARGEVVVEPALVDALRARRIAGAYLDVFAHEPLAPDSPLWDLPNVIATPHSAGFSDANERHVDRMFLDQLVRSAAGGA